MSSIRWEFGTQWKHVGYALGLEHSVLECIELNDHKTEERAFRMLNEWIQRDAKSCYCKLISAMYQEGLVEGVEILKRKIKSSKVPNLK